ncbi:MAG TPA: hypothetical protein VGK10_00215 [Prolixibacteraceae bacterium]|jgi:hypothetical protein
MKKFRIGLAVVIGIVLIINLTMVDYSSLGWSKNLGAYVRILSNVLILGALACSKKESTDKHTNVDGSKQNG